MTICTHRLRTIFNAAIASARPLLTNGLGLEVCFSGEADITAAMGGTRNGMLVKGPFIAPDLHRLVTEWGFVALQNAWLGECSPDAKLSGVATAAKGTLQDPFHIDSPFEGKVTGLYKFRSDKRGTPTVYASLDSVKTAIAEVYQEKVRDLPEGVQQAMLCMLASDYTFAVGGRHCEVRIPLQREFPEFTALVASRIPEGQKYEHHWVAGVSSAVFHSNRPGNIVHARAHSYEPVPNNILGLTISAN